MLPLFIWIMVTISIGFLLITCLLPALPYSWPQLLLRLSLGIGLGFGLTSGVTFLLLFYYCTSSTTILIADIAIFLILLAICYSTKSQ